MRRGDGNPDRPHDEHVIRSEWLRYRGPMVEWARLTPETEESAKKIAREHDGWPCEW